MTDKAKNQNESLQAGQPSLGETEAVELSPQDKKRKAELFDSPVQAATVKADTTVANLVEQMKGMSIQARNIGMCADVLHNMLTDADRPIVFLGLAGPLIAAGLRNVIRDLIVNRVVDVVVSTGAILYQDIYQARGFRHYQGAIDADDTELRDLYIDRIYDTYVDEMGFWDNDAWCGRIADEMTPGPHSSRDYLAYLGSKLNDENSIVYQCYKNGIPIFAPALNDSSIGIGLTDHHYRCYKEGRTPVSIDSIRDNFELAQIVVKAQKTAAIYVAGGVPKNYINDAIVMSYIFGKDRGHAYAIQTTTAVVHDGGLSSSTLSEARSWGKIRKEADFAMAWVEPSVALPLFAGYIAGNNLTANRPRMKFNWDGETLKSIDPIK
jgi:deoxyhypusine synthase